MRYEIWKGRIFLGGKRRTRTRVDRVKKHQFQWCRWWSGVFFFFNEPNHMLVGGVSVNSLFLHQGGLFAISVNKNHVCCGFVHHQVYPTMITSASGNIGVWKMPRILYRIIQIITQVNACCMTHVKTRSESLIKKYSWTSSYCFLLENVL